jgi:hypothetical protein
MLHAIDHVPVIKPSPAKGFLVHVEADGLDDVQPAPSRGARSADVSRVVGNLRVQQHDMKRRIGHRQRSLPHSHCHDVPYPFQMSHFV